jgi:hypothetical protein
LPWTQQQKSAPPQPWPWPSHRQPKQPPPSKTKPQTSPRSRLGASCSPSLLRPTANTGSLAKQCSRRSLESTAVDHSGCAIGLWVQVGSKRKEVNGGAIRLSGPATGHAHLNRVEKVERRADTTPHILVSEKALDDRAAMHINTAVHWRRQFTGEMLSAHWGNPGDRKSYLNSLRPIQLALGGAQFHHSDHLAMS